MKLKDEIEKELSKMIKKVYSDPKDSFFPYNPYMDGFCTALKWVLEIKEKELVQIHEQ